MAGGGALDSGGSSLPLFPSLAPFSGAPRAGAEKVYQLFLITFLLLGAGAGGLKPSLLVMGRPSEIPLSDQRHDAAPVSLETQSITELAADF